ncbi:hypothetical protein BJ508DRAFT_416271 [Ascobolus immersus RN42]|uniref:Uncharacterized protein n=1 Tax=Ascobolus immersus RN42 TaxID=1160509 RepID=A0A3N4HZ10_ASCIM|nr:hypothetical protein BJ508DRAFT_416271 [Ascobolus immersus RN42]
MSHRFELSHILLSNTPLTTEAIAVNPLAAKVPVTLDEATAITEKPKPTTIVKSEPKTSKNEPSLPAGRILGDLVDLTVDLVALPSEGNTRVRLTEDEKVILIRTCYEFGDYYIEGRSKDQFWLRVQAMMSKKLGKRIGNPRQQVTRMLNAFEAANAVEKTSSGKPILDTDLKQALWAWKAEWIDREAAEKSLTESEKQAKAKDRDLALAQQRSMLETLADKPNFEATKIALKTEPGESKRTKQEKTEALKAKRRRIRDREDLLENEYQEDGNQMAETLNSIANVTEMVLGALAGGAGEEKDKDRLDRMDKDLDAIKKMADENSRQMQMVIEMLKQQKEPQAPVWFY